jgi:hypothetical protein
LSVKTLYTVYRAWSEERGEKPLTQIAFHRKLMDRNLTIVGSGSQATVGGRSLIPRAVPSGEVDWSVASRFAR